MFNNYFRFEVFFEGLWKYEKKIFCFIFILIFVLFIILIFYFIVIVLFDFVYINVVNEIFDKSFDKNFLFEYLKNMYLFWIIFKYVVFVGILVFIILMFLFVL